jgi:membrane protein implicated in regulation of membrane protease activity
MQIQYWWWSFALALAIFELLSGTFYLLVFAAGCVAAGGVAALGAPVWTQFLAAAVVSLAGAAWIRHSRAGAPEPAPAGRNPDVVADVGERVRVDAWGSDGRARIQYRGTQWNVELADGETAVPGDYTIHEVSGNRLIVAHRGPPMEK